MCSDLKGKEKKDLLVLINLLWDEDASEESYHNLAVHIKKENDPIHCSFFITLLRTRMVSFMCLNFIVSQKLILEASGSGNCALGLPTIPWWTNHQFMSTK